MGYRQLLNFDPECWLLACSCSLAQGLSQGSASWKLNSFFDCPSPMKSMAKILYFYRASLTENQECSGIKLPSNYSMRLFPDTRAYRGTYPPTHLQNPDRICTSFLNDKASHSKTEGCVSPRSYVFHYQRHQKHEITQRNISAELGHAGYGEEI